jgi:hypothetical protein
MQHYKAILLVISTPGGVYDEFRKIYESYCRLHKDVKVLFVYGNAGTTFKPALDNDLVFDNIPENYYPGMLLKTIKAVEYINSTYSYEYLVRTNLSTFWVFNKLLNRLSTLPKTNVVCGTYRQTSDNFGNLLPEYIAGTGLIMSRDATDVLISDPMLLDVNYPEDYAISECFRRNNIQLTRAVPRPVCVLEQDQMVSPQQVISLAKNHGSNCIDHYRIKSTHDFRSQDLIIANTLLKFYYGELMRVAPKTL